MTGLELPGPIGRRPRPRRAALVRRTSDLIKTGKEILHRTLDFVLAAAVSLILLPVLVLRAGIALLQTGRFFDRQVLLGRFRVPFERLQFAGSFPGRWFAVLANITRGDLSWTGPRPLNLIEADDVPMEAWVRFRIRPGLVSTYRLRARVGLAHEAESTTDRDYFYSQTLGESLGMLARALPSAMLGGTASAGSVSILRFLGVDIVNTTMDEAVGWIARRAKERTDSQLCFVNPDCLNIAYGDTRYRRVLERADRVLPDGVGIHLACRISGTSLVANVNGTDLFPRICEMAAIENLSLFLLGAASGRAEESARNMQLRFGELKIVGTHSGYFEASEESALIEEINYSQADILLVGLGAPRQDIWIADNFWRLSPSVKIGVGGLFDFYSDKIQRAPQWMREIGLEWLWRLIKEPRRMWRRYVIGNPLFLFRVWRESRFGHVQQP